ncbi:hypothetical protein, partial [Bacteroides stercoris]
KIERFVSDSAEIWICGLYSRLSVFLSGENLATITRYSGMDPECGGWDALKYPVSRVFSLGVKLTY